MPPYRERDRCRQRRSAWSSAALIPLMAACAVLGYPSPAPPTPVAVEVATGAGGSAGSLSGDSYEVRGGRYYILASGDGYRERGLASWYGREFAGRPTSSGEIFDPDALTAAHRTLPFSTLVEVVNLANQRSVVVRVNDRGPFEDPDERIIDVSRATADALGMIGPGVVRVEVRALPARSAPLGSSR